MSSSHDQTKNVQAAGTIRITSRWGRFPKWDEMRMQFPFRSPRWCAGGLQILIFERADAGQTVVGQFPMTCAPLATQATVSETLQVSDGILQ